MSLQGERAAENLEQRRRPEHCPWGGGEVHLRAELAYSAQWSMSGEGWERSASLAGGVDFTNTICPFISLDYCEALTNLR